MIRDYETLLAEVKTYLRIDHDTDDLLLLSTIKRGEARLNKIAGHELGYEESSMERSLLMDYVRYSRSYALEVYEKNFQSELLELHYSAQAAVSEEVTDTDEDQDTE